MVKITKRGFKGNGVYVGRPSPFGNPFPIKKSKFSNRVYSLEESLKLYEKHFRENLLRSGELKGLVERYKKEGYLELDCWCVDRDISSSEEVGVEECRCHAEIIAFYILCLSEPILEEGDEDGRSGSELEAEHKGRGGEHRSGLRSLGRPECSS